MAGRASLRGKGLHSAGPFAIETSCSNSSINVLHENSLSPPFVAERRGRRAFPRSRVSI